MRKLAQIIVKNRILIMLLFAVLCIACIFTSRLTVVSNDLYHFLPENTETRRGLDAMEGEFMTYATANVLIKDVSYEDAAAAAERIAAVEGVKSVSFDDSRRHYRHGNALINVTLDGRTADEVSVDAVGDIREMFYGDDSTFISTEVGVDYSKEIVSEMLFVGALAVAIVIAMLLLTSRSFAEVPVLLLTFGAAALLQLGTNYIFDSISYISNSVTLILQLALAIDYAVILCNRFAEEKQSFGQKEAMVEALSKAIPEISSSSLTTICGLIAMTFMQFGLGADLGRVLIKSIIFSMLSVFLLMPGLLLMFGRAIDKTRHRSFVPRIDAFGRFAWKTRKIVPPIFIVVAVLAFFLSLKCPLGYNYNDMRAVKLGERQLAREEIVSAFGHSNMMALVVPTGDYETEAKMLDEMSSLDHVTEVVGLACVDAIDGYRLGDKLTIDEFSELADLDKISASALFAYYGARNSDYSMVEEDLHNYKVPLVDLFEFLYEVAESGDIEIPQDKLEMIESLYTQLTDAKAQLQGRHYSRMLVYCNTAVQSDESYSLVSDIHNIAESYYGEDVYVTGDATCARDLDESYTRDNIITSVLSAVFVMLIILFTFRSAGLAILLIAVIQGSIWINFSVPLLTGDPIFFVGYLIVGAIQMGANIDYAIVVSNRYLALREQLPKHKAIIGALNGALPTLLTSGSILAFAGLLIGLFTTESTTSGIGIALGRGTFISLALVFFVLPQFLLWGDKFIMKTKITRNYHVRLPAGFREDFDSVARRHRK